MDEEMIFLLGRCLFLLTGEKGDFLRVLVEEERGVEILNAVSMGSCDVNSVRMAKTGLIQGADSLIKSEIIDVLNRYYNLLKLYRKVTPV